jgi:hypothetical protein
MVKHLTEDGLYARAQALAPFFETALHDSFAHHPDVVSAWRGLPFAASDGLRTNKIFLSSCSSA